MKVAKLKHNNKGETLIEVVLAVGLAVMVLFALVVLGSSSVKTSTSSTRRLEAEKLASSGVEAIRYLRDANGFDGLADACYKIDDSGSSVSKIDGPCASASSWISISLGTGNSFDRKIEVASYAGTLTMKKVTSTARWVETGGSGSGGSKSVVISTVLSKW